ncbi:helix-turn-helix domain-containing protein [Knoellia sp. CPCC 206453]|uniref:helix-turn-helix domain-containing protein n=1 Tax=Knoellia pratensis TaxID=3404796 RepID=UPI0036072B98
MTPERRAAIRQAELDDAVRRLTVADAVGLALRAHRRRLGLSQRAYAAVRGRPPVAIARLESSAGSLRLDDVVEALEGTGFALALVTRADSDAGTVAATVVEPGSWPLTELLARVRDGSRRFPAHHDTEAVINPPKWWWHREFFVGKGPEPQWYAPRPTPGRGGSPEQEDVA